MSDKHGKIVWRILDRSLIPNIGNNSKSTRHKTLGNRHCFLCSGLYNADGGPNL